MFFGHAAIIDQNTTIPGEIEETRLMPPEESQEGATQHPIYFNTKRIWSRSTKCGRMSLLAAAVLVIVLFTNVIGLFLDRAEQGIELNLPNRPDHEETVAPSVHPSLPQPEPLTPPPVTEEYTIPPPVRNYSKEAYVTLLAPSHPHPWTLGEPDYYFEACKIKAHRLLRNTTTRDPHGRPFIVLVTSDVPQKQVEILESHGAIVKLVSTLSPPAGTVDWDRTNPRYRDQFTKLHIWNMTEYERIAFFDADTLPIRAVHTIFDTPTQRTGDEEWLFGAVYDSGESRLNNLRNEPGLEDKGRPGIDTQLNAGVFLLWPTQKQSEYIWDMYFDPPRRDWSVFMEQDMLRWAYRDEGIYPWIRLSHLFNTQWCKEWDLDTAYVLHDKLWGESHIVDPELRRVWYQAWGEMVGWDAPRSAEGILHWQEGLGTCNHGEL